MNHVRAMRIFVRVAELGSLTAASQDLGYTRGMASAIVKELETHLGTRLLERTTRAIRLTDAGLQYAERARTILAEIDTLEDEIGASEKTPAGHLRIQIPAGLARLVVAPELPRFFQTYPGITLDILSRNAVPDFVADRLDAALFVGDLPDSNFRTRTVGRIPILTLAAPEYLAQRGTPETPADLAAHDTIGIISTVTGRTVDWLFRQGKSTIRVHPEGHLAIENAEAAVVAASAGLGLVQVASYLVYRDVRAQRLVPVLTACQPPAPEIRLLAPASALKPRKLRVFEDFLVDTGKRFRRTWNIRKVA